MTAVANKGDGFDFPDFFSPILVKELRQGVETMVFTISFIVLQFFLVFDFALSSMLLLGKESSGGVGSGLFWTVLVLVLCVVMPARGLVAVSQEKSAHTLDLLTLTRLSAWEIVRGKWFSLVYQTTLFVLATLPYFILRYFLGGVDLAQDVITLVHLFVFSAVATAAAIMLSTFRMWVRVVVGAALVPSCWVMGLVLIFSLFSSSGVRGVLGAWGVWVAGLVVFGGLLTLGLLSKAADAIAPRSDNYSLRMRLIALGFVMASLLSLSVLDRAALVPTLLITGGVVMGTGVFALLEGNFVVPSMTLPFRGWRRRWGWFFYPGWASGVLFFILAMVAYGGVLGLTGWVHRDFVSEDLWLMAFHVMNLLMIPAAVLQYVRVAPTWALGGYLGLQFGFLLVGILLMEMVRTADSPMLAMLCLPMSAALLMRMNEIPHDVGLVLAIGSGVLFVGVCVWMLVRGRGHFMEISRAWRKAHSESGPASL